jgi:uncharacterized membrane protein YkoI
MCLGRRAGLVCQPAESWLHLEEMTMTPPSSKYRILRRGALLLIIATFALAAPITGRHAMEAFAKDGDGGKSGPGGGDSDNDNDNDSDNDSDNDNDNDNDNDSDNDSDNDNDNDSDNDNAGGSDDNGSDGGGGSGSSGKGGSSSSGSGGKSSGSKSQSQSRDSALATRLKGRIAPIGEIESLAGRAVPGEIIDIKLYRNKERYIYKVKIIQRSGSIYDVRIDAVSRKLLSARER